jgi:hypothetical protein
VASFGKVINAIRTDILACWDELSILDDEIKEQEFPLYFHAIEKLNDDAVSICDDCFCFSCYNPQF